MEEVKRGEGDVCVLGLTCPSRVSMVLMRTVFFESISEARWCSGTVSETRQHTTDASEVILKQQKKGEVHSHAPHGAYINVGLIKSLINLFNITLGLFWSLFLNIFYHFTPIGITNND